MFSRILLIIVILVAATINSSAQTNITQSNAADASKATSREQQRGDDSSPSQNMLEMRERWRLEAEEKDHRELLERSDRAARLSLELNRSFVQNNQFLATDSGKLTDLEKLVKKVRKSLGGGDDDEEEETDKENKPVTLGDALARLSETGALLNDELKKQSRHELSADAISRSNEILDLITLIRSFAGLK